jgi:hypothetical protein
MYTASDVKIIVPVSGRSTCIDMHPTVWPGVSINVTPGRSSVSPETVSNSRPS